MKKENQKRQMNKPKEYLKDPHFHHKDKGCETEDALRPGEGDYMFHCQRCKTHDMMICPCGWEFGWHYGTESKIMSPAPFNMPQIPKRRFKLRELAEMYGVSESTISRRLRSK